MSSSLRNLAYAGAIAGLISCAGAQVKVSTGPESAAPAGSASKKSGLQSCLIEGISKDCKAKSKDDDSFYSCTEEKLALKDYEQKSFGVEASKGDEVISMRFGSGVIFDIAAVQVASIDEKGVDFSITVDRIHIAKPDEKTSVQKGTVNVTYEGAMTGDLSLFKQLEVWGMSVEKKGEKVSVKYSTMDPSAIAPKPAIATE
jgi:hypothetical protein